MTSSTDVITKAPSSRELSLIPGSREISQVSLEHARTASPPYTLPPKGSPLLGGLPQKGGSPLGVVYTLPPKGGPPLGGVGGLHVTGSRDAVSYLDRRQREPQLLEGGGGSPTEGSGPPSASPPQGSLKEEGAVITTQPGSTRTVGGEVKAATLLSRGSTVIDPQFDREMMPLGRHDVIRIQQQMEHDLKGGCGAGNSYAILADDGTPLYNIGEDSNCFCRWLCGPNRMSHMTLYDLEEQPVLHLDRACCRCDCCCCFSCCLCQHDLQVRDARGRLVGKVKQRFHLLQLRLQLQDGEGQRVMQVTGPCCALRCCSEMTFDIMNATGLKEVGYILKKWDESAPVGAEFVNVDHENIEITMPRHCTAEERALVVGAAMLASLMYMELS